MGLGEGLREGFFGLLRIFWKVLKSLLLLKELFWYFGLELLGFSGRG
jgi:hypothetical protein